MKNFVRSLAIPCTCAFPRLRTDGGVWRIPFFSALIATHDFALAALADRRLQLLDGTSQPLTEDEEFREVSCDSEFREVSCACTCAFPRLRTDGGVWRIPFFSALIATHDFALAALADRRLQLLDGTSQPLTEDEEFREVSCDSEFREVSCDSVHLCFSAPPYGRRCLAHSVLLRSHCNARFRAGRSCRQATAIAGRNIAAPDRR